MGYRIVTNKNNYLMHKGKKGMKWGFNDGKKNGKRTADPEWKMYEEVNQDSKDYWLTAKKNPNGTYRVPETYTVKRGSDGKKYSKKTYRTVNSDKVYTKFDQAIDKKNAKARKQAAYVIKRAKRRTSAERMANKAVDAYEKVEKGINDTKKSFSKKLRKLIKKYK